MLLKKLFKTPADWTPKLNVRASGVLVDPTKPEGACLNPPAFAGVSVAHTGTGPEQNFAPSMVEDGIALGYISIAKGVLTLHAVEGDLAYTIVRGPGRYCCHCGERIGAGGRGDKVAELEAREHVAAAHGGKPSPDKGNPAGYRWVTGYETVLDSAAHEKHKAAPGAPATFSRLANGAIEARKAAREAAVKAGKKRNIVAGVAVLIGLALLLVDAGFADLSVLLAANFCFNIAKGRVAELYNRVDTNDPTNSALLVIPLESSGLETQANLEDSDNFTEVVDGATNEATTGNWARKTLTDADIAAFAPDDTNNRVNLVIPDQTWTAVTGNAVGALIVAYDNDTTGGTDSNVIPLTHHDFSITPDGSDVTADVPATGFFQAS